MDQETVIEFSSTPHPGPRVPDIAPLPQGLSPVQTVASLLRKAPMGSRRRMQRAAFHFFRTAALINGAALAVILLFLVVNGWRAINWTFLTQPPMDSMTKGGIFPCIVGTLCLSVGAIVLALPIGVASAIFLHDYAVQ